MNLTILIQSASLQKKIWELAEDFIESVDDLIEQPSSISADIDKSADMFITDYAYLQKAGPEDLKNLKSRNPGSRIMVLHHATGKQYAEDCFNADADYMIDTNDGMTLIPDILTDLFNKKQ